MATTNLNIRTDKEIKEAAEKNLFEFRFKYDYCN